MSAFLTQGCDRQPIWEISVLVLHVQLTRATAVSPLILCVAGYKSQVQPANPQSREISTECQKLKQKRTKWIQYNYITCYTKSLDRHVATHLPGIWKGALRDGTNNDQARHYNRNPLLSIIVQLLYSGRPLNSLPGGLSDDLRDKHSVQRIVYRLQ